MAPRASCGAHQRQIEFQRAAQSEPESKKCQGRDKLACYCCSLQRGRRQTVLALRTAFFPSLLLLLTLLLMLGIGQLSGLAAGAPILVGWPSDRSYVSASPLVESNGVEQATTSTTAGSLLFASSYYSNNHQDHGDARETSDRRETSAPVSSLESSPTQSNSMKAPLAINEQFNTKLATIIRTRESLSMGATFLNYTLVTSLNACLVECWITDSCDTIIYQESPVDFNNHLPSLKAQPFTNPVAAAAAWHLAHNHQYTHHHKSHKLSGLGNRQDKAELDVASNLFPERQPHLQASHYRRHQHNRHQQKLLTLNPHSNYYDYSEQQQQQQQNLESGDPFLIENNGRRKQRGITQSSSSNSNVNTSSNSSKNNIRSRRSNAHGSSRRSLSSNSNIEGDKESSELSRGPTDGGSGFFVCYLFQCAKQDGFKCQFSPHNYYISSTVRKHLSSSEDNYHVLENQKNRNADDEQQATTPKSSSAFHALELQQQQQPIRYSSIVERSDQPHWFTRHDSHFSSIHIGGNEELAHLGGFNSAIIAILMGFGATGILMIIVGHKMKSIRRRIAHKRRRALPADQAITPVELLTNISATTLLMPI